MPTDKGYVAKAGHGDSIILRWTIHLAREHPRKLLILIALLSVSMAAGYWVIGALGPIAVVLAMGGALAEFLFPVTYELTEQGAVCKTLVKFSEIKWKNVKSCYLDDLGIKLSPLKHQSRLEAFRGVYLRFGNNRNEVIEAVKSMRAKQC